MPQPRADFRAAVLRGVPDRAGAAAFFWEALVFLAGAGLPARPFFAAAVFAAAGLAAVFFGAAVWVDAFFAGGFLAGTSGAGVEPPERALGNPLGAADLSFTGLSPQISSR